MESYRTSSDDHPSLDRRNEMNALAVVAAVVVLGLGLAGACVLAWELDAMYDERKSR